MLDLYSIIWRVSGRRQIVLILLSFGIAGLSAVPLSYQKQIINTLAETAPDLERVLVLGAQMMAIILLSLGLKWLMSYRSGILGEDIIRMLRRRIYQNAADVARSSEATPASGTLSTIVSAEAEELGKFTGSAFSQPVVQIGTLITVVTYIASTQPGLGAIALAMIAPQVILVLATQQRVNELVAERVRLLRGATNAMGDVDDGVVLQNVLDDFDAIYDTRQRMFLWKLSTKFGLSAMNGLGTVSVLVLGGWLVIEGRTDVGTVVAATLGLSRLQSPTAFMMAYYRQVSATRVKYELLREVLVAPAQTDKSAA